RKHSRQNRLQAFPVRFFSSHLSPSMKPSPRFFSTKTVFLLAVTGALAACGQPEQPPSAANAPEVGVYTLREQALGLTTDLPGRTAAYRIAELRPQVTGIIQERMFNEGAEVKKGQ